jgi:hypothetical protein
MLTFVSGWRSVDRDKVLLDQRDTSRPSLFFVDETSSIPGQFPVAPIVDVWRNGQLDLPLQKDCPTQIVRLNYDTDNQLIMPALSRALMQGTDAQIIIAFDAVNTVYRLLPMLRAGSAILAADARLQVAEGDHVIFTRGGSFAWRDHLVETQTASLVGDETLDMGVIDADEILDYSV